MWRVKIQEWKDQPTNGNTNFYPSKFEMFLPTAKLILEMLEPIHGSGRVITHDSSFCMTVGILACTILEHLGRPASKRGDVSSVLVFQGPN